MKLKISMGFVVFGLGMLLAGVAANAGSMPGLTAFTPNQLRWVDLWNLPKGAQAAAVEGTDYRKAGFMVFLKLPPGYVLPPHWHPADETATVVEGSMIFGMGETVDPSDAQNAITVPAGSFLVVQGKMNHWAKTEEGVTILVQSLSGPLVTCFVNAADNPLPENDPLCQ